VWAGGHVSSSHVEEEGARGCIVCLTYKTKRRKPKNTNHNEHAVDGMGLSFFVQKQKPLTVRSCTLILSLLYFLIHALCLCASN
jgi:hypothetical protein